MSGNQSRAKCMSGKWVSGNQGVTLYMSDSSWKNPKTGKPVNEIRSRQGSGKTRSSSIDKAKEEEESL